jgi:glycosyltransferase involved in cell wall biosynthesis
MIKLLTFTTLYPNAQRRSHGVFVENRIRHLVASGQATTKVIAPVPYVPALSILPERYRILGGVPTREERYGIDVYHPRYFLLPKVSMLAAPFSLYVAVRRQMSRLLTDGYAFDAIDAHYFYPDGIAAMLLGRHFGKPVTITARGSDVTKLGQYHWPRKMIRWAATEAAGIIAVCESLKTELVELGVRPDKIRVLRNGVDLTMFRPTDREAARKRLRLEGSILLSVGHLIPRKGHDLAIKALQYLPDKQLVIVGTGPEFASLKNLADHIGVANRVRFLGEVAHDKLAELYSAADLGLLMSTQEGWANVLLESLACGTPMVATDAGGTPEVLASPVAGEIVRERNAVVVARAVDAVLARGIERAAVRRYAEGFSWDATTRGQLDLFDHLLRNAERGVGAPKATIDLGTRGAA